MLVKQVLDWDLKQKGSDAKYDDIDLLLNDGRKSSRPVFWEHA